jgi:hypothetical protein
MRVQMGVLASRRQPPARQPPACQAERGEVGGVCTSFSAEFFWISKTGAKDIIISPPSPYVVG